MSKVSTVTFHRAENYGAILQTYALQQAIMELGFKSEVIDYTCPETSEPYQALYKKNLGTVIKSLAQYKSRKNKNIKFRNFIQKYIRVSKPLKREDLPQYADKCKAIVVGSDQVWNYGMIGGDTYYFLDFVKDSSKKVSYAASIALQEIPAKWENEYKKYLSDFHNLSLREKTGVEIVEKLLQRKGERDLDPVFLLEASKWKEMIGDKSSEKYIFLYMPDDLTAQYAKRLAEEKHLKIIQVSYGYKWRHKVQNIGECIYDASPEEFLSLLYHAEYVVTRSFHATAFSIIFNKEFFVNIHKTVGSRVTDLLTDFSLSKRIFDNVSLLEEGNIDWSLVNNELIKKRERSIENLSMYLKR